MAKKRDDKKPPKKNPVDTIIDIVTAPVIAGAKAGQKAKNKVKSTVNDAKRRYNKTKQAVKDSTSIDEGLDVFKKVSGYGKKKK